MIWGYLCSSKWKLRPQSLPKPSPPAPVNSAVRHPDGSKQEEKTPADKKQQMGFHGDSSKCLSSGTEMGLQEEKHRGGKENPNPGPNLPRWTAWKPFVQIIFLPEDLKRERGLHLLGA